MRRLWLLFSQTVTVSLAILFIVATLRPEWLRGGGHSTPASAPEAANVPAAVSVAPSDGPVASFAQAVAAAGPSVVNIYTSKHVDVPVMRLPADPALRELLRAFPGFTRREETTSLGSGVIMRADGHILTNYHVVEAADAIEVSLADGRAARATLVGADPDTDLAVLRVKLPNLRPIAYNNEHRPQVGDVVLAIGNPFGVGQTTTLGIVSALGRNRLGINLYENFIQTDAAINPGNSGGALVDTRGRLIGINTAIYSETGGSLGIGFAIPAPIAQHILGDIIDDGVVTRGWFGVEPQDMTPDLARALNWRGPHGVIIAAVLPDAPAQRAGMRVGDIVQRLDGQPVRDAVGFLNQIALLDPGSQAKVQLWREGREMTLEIRTGTRPIPGRSGR